MRAITSSELPAVKGTMTRIGLEDGQACAKASLDSAGVASVAAVRLRNLRRVVMVIVPLDFLEPVKRCGVVVKHALLSRLRIFGEHDAIGLDQVGVARMQFLQRKIAAVDRALDAEYLD